MELLLGYRAVPFPLRPPLVYSSKLKRNVGLRAKLSYENDPLLQAAMNAASLRYQETHRPEPLFVDPYAGCLVHPNIQTDLKKKRSHYCLATKFIDDKLLRTVNHIDGLKQVVLLTDGMDTRPYRLNWPSSTIIFDISPEQVFKKAAEKLRAVGAKIPRGCSLLHVPRESSNIQQILRTKGFSGSRPSIWAIQGLPLITLASFEEILFAISGLAMNGSFFLGELPAWLAETEVGIKSTTENWVENEFTSNGFRVDVINYNDVATSLRKEIETKDYKNMLFVAEHLQFSDDQMEAWRRAFRMVEEEGDEEGFEEL
ncbi:hypothetical protein SLEP1_g32040 [Rubroshorea leprosula]|uniref:S-adenosyl-L-methionine-dependent methyltransferase n=1 Tax=Rubroshorea leprosula TaxID=152421 RepID=A0AAV5KC18_9ROSI|nr:hypothetical protein SLEP1_g32040 [Rubroshorea leprosula]